MILEAKRRATIGMLLSLGAWTPLAGQEVANLLVPLPALELPHSDTDSDGPDSVAYRANLLTWDEDEGTLFLEGRSWLRWRSTELFADTIRYDVETRVVEARGTPQVLDPGSPPFAGHVMRYGLRTRNAVVEQAWSRRGGEWTRGAEVRRLSDRTLQVLDADFCTCEGVEPPDYMFSSRTMLMEPGVVAVAAPVVLSIEGVPVAAVPLALFPLARSRRSGLLVPKLGGDQRQGFFVRNLGAFLVLGDHADLHASTDVVEGMRGRFDLITARSQLRYRHRYWLDGEIEALRTWKELGNTGRSWELRYSHSQQFVPAPGRNTLVGRGSLVSSRTARRERATDVQELLDQTANASLDWQWRGRGSSVLLGVSQQENLVTGLRTREAPRFSAQSSGQLFPWGPAAQDAAWQAWRWSWSARANRWEDRKASSDTLSARPTDLMWTGASQTVQLGATHSVLRHLRLTPSLMATHHASFNRWTEALDTADRWRSFGSGNGAAHHVLLGSASVGLATDLYGIWMPHWGRFEGLRHTLTPQVSTTWTPEVPDNPNFVAHPRLGQAAGQRRSRRLGLSLGQKLDARLRAPGDTVSPRGTPISLLGLTTSTSWNLDALSRPWSPLLTSVTTGLPRGFSLSGRAEHSLYDRFSADSTREGWPVLESWSVDARRTWSFGGSFHDGTTETDGRPRRAPWSLALDFSQSWTGTRVTPVLYRVRSTRTAGLAASLHPTERWSLRWNAAWSFERNDFASQQLHFNRQIGCWNLAFGWTPEGPARGWTFLVQVRDLPDLKLEAQSTTLRGRPRP